MKARDGAVAHGQPALAGRLRQLQEAIFSFRAREEHPRDGAEDLWDPACIPLEVVLPGRAWFVRWRFRAAGRR